MTFRIRIWSLNHSEVTVVWRTRSTKHQMKITQVATSAARLSDARRYGAAWVCTETAMSAMRLATAACALGLLMKTMADVWRMRMATRYELVHHDCGWNLSSLEESHMRSVAWVIIMLGRRLGRRSWTVVVLLAAVGVAALVSSAKSCAYENVSCVASWSFIFCTNCSTSSR